MLPKSAALTLAVLFLAACGGGAPHTASVRVSVRSPAGPAGLARSATARLAAVDDLAGRCQPPGGYAELLNARTQAAFYDCTHPGLLKARLGTVRDTRVSMCLRNALGAATGRDKSILRANAASTVPAPSPGALKALTVTCLLGAPGPPARH